jgi:hypothetical protein
MGGWRKEIQTTVFKGFHLVLKISNMGVVDYV